MESGDVAPVVLAPGEFVEVRVLGGVAAGRLGPAVFKAGIALGFRRRSRWLVRAGLLRFGFRPRFDRPRLKDFLVGRPLTTGKRSRQPDPGNPQSHRAEEFAAVKGSMAKDVGRRMPVLGHVPRSANEVLHCRKDFIVNGRSGPDRRNRESPGSVAARSQPARGRSVNSSQSSIFSQDP